MKELQFLRSFLKRFISLFVILLMILGFYPVIELGGKDNVSLSLEKSPISLNAEAQAAVDPLAAIAQLVNATGSVSDYVEINSAYQLNGYTALPAAGATFLSVPGNYPSFKTQSNGENQWKYAQNADPAWSQSGSTIKATYSDTAVGDDASFANTNASAKVNAKVLQIKANRTVTISFSYSTETVFTSGVSSGDKTQQQAYLYYLISDKANPTVQEVKAGTTVLNGETSTGNGQDYSLTVESGNYLYLYFFGYVRIMEKTIGCNGTTSFNYSFNASVSGFKIEPQDQTCSLTLGNCDSSDAPIGSGSITINQATQTVGSNGLAEGLTNVAANTRVNLSVAKVPSGYTHVGWRNKTSGEDIYDYEYSFSLTSDMEVFALFVPEITVQMGSNGYENATYSYKTPSGSIQNGADQFVARNSSATKFYKSLAAAFADTDVVVLVGNVTLNGDFTVPQGKTLSVPYDLQDPATASLKKEAGTGGVSFYTSATINGSLTLDGSLVVSARQSTNQGQNGKAFGKVGRVIVGQSGHIRIGSTGKLYAYGMVTGAGSIDVASGGAVYELMEIRDMRAVEALFSAYNNNKAFPFSHFFIKTNEVATTYAAGAKLRACYYVNVSGIVSSGEIPVIDSASSMFINNGSVTKSFHSEAPYNNKILFTINDGEVKTGSFTISISAMGSSMSINSANYYLPINYCYGFEIGDGAQFVINNNYKMLPGSMLDVKSGGTLNIASGANVVLYRANDYDFRSYSSAAAQGFCSTGYPTAFTKPSGLSYASNTAANVGSAQINVDGLLIANGGIYVTEKLTGNTNYANGFNTLTGTGEVRIASSMSGSSISEETQQGTNSTTTVSVTTVPLKGNVDASLTSDDGQTGYQSLGRNSWYGHRNDSGVSYWNNTQELSFTVTWLNEDGTELEKDLNVASGSIPSYDGAVPTKAATEEYTYTFAGWKIQGGDTVYTAETLPAVTADTTYVAAFTQNTREYNEPTWTWTGNTSASATFTAKDDVNYKMTVTASVTSATTPASCTEAGKTVYTATVSFHGKTYTDTKETAIPALGHDWNEPGYTWADDNSMVTATRICKSDASHVETETVNTTSEVTKPAACETRGETTYTAAFTNTAFTTQTRTVENIDALGHDWNEPGYTWADDNSTVTATRTCRNDASHVETETVDTTSEASEASCTESGTVTYTASFINTAFETQVKVVETQPALGHAWSDVSYTWAEDYSTVTATRVCALDASHTETETAVSSVEIVKVPSCEESGETVYTAVFANAAFETQSISVKTDPLGHDWGEPTWAWDGCNAATASFVCSNDEAHTVTLDAGIEKEEHIPDCEADGAVIYTATVILDGVTYSDSKTETLPATGHRYGEPDYLWIETEDGYYVSAMLTCLNNPDHMISEGVDATYEVIVEPTERENGLGRYTAVFENEVFTTQTKDIVLPKFGPDGYWITVEDYTNGAAEHTLDLDELYRGETSFEVSADKAVLVAIRKGETYEPVKCTTDEDGRHIFRVNVEEDTVIVFAYKGDVNLDAVLSLKDNLLIKKHIAGTAEFKLPLPLLLGDVNEDGQIKLTDTLMIKKSIAGAEELIW